MKRGNWMTLTVAVLIAILFIGTGAARLARTMRIDTRGSSQVKCRIAYLFVESSGGAVG